MVTWLLSSPATYGAPVMAVRWPSKLPEKHYFDHYYRKSLLKLIEKIIELKNLEDRPAGTEDAAERKTSKPVCHL
ncbi:hypothetical protein IGI04_030598 [Brassica rapa subsp. trilocularis]|uniref:Uncharacterized protein n=1 Tax=Brassica rapa subsp. trilocularis TaxID=1813537 RepID=A0ABQ7LR69_BRACM|nr:hypothetical protein IGI04_030598 [Brassica rapa subsp. trilocularis]